MRIIPNMSWNALLGENLGKAVGGGLAGGLEALTEHKMGQMAQQKKSQGLSALGYSPDQVKGLVNLPDPLLQQYLKNDHAQKMQQQKFAYQNQLMDQTRGLFDENNNIQNGQPNNNLQQNNQQQDNGYELGQKIFGNNEPLGPVGPMGEQLLPQKKQQPSNYANQQLKKEVRAPMAMKTPIGLPAKLHMQFEQEKLKKQARADATNQGFKDPFLSEVKLSNELIDLLDTQQRLRETNKVSTGFAGAYKPLWAQNHETKTYNANSNRIAVLLAGLSKGVPTNFKIKMEQLAKANIEQDYETQKLLEDQVRKKVEETLDKKKIYDDILLENDNYLPPNVSSIIDRRYDDLKKNNITSQQSGLGVKPNEQKAIQQPESGKSTFSPSNIARVGSGLAARFAEPVGEQLQDLASLGLGAANYLTEGKVPTYGQMREKYPFLPPQELSEITDKITQGYTAPQGDVEQFFQNAARAAGTLASVLVGGASKAITKGLSLIVNPKIAATIPKLVMPFSGISWQRALGLGIASESTGKVLEGLGASPTQQGLGKMAILLAGSGGYGKGAMLKSAEESYQAAEKSGAGKLVNIKNAELKLNDLANKTAKGFDPNKKIVEGVIDEARNALNSNKTATSQVPINSLVELKKQANKWYSMAESPRVPGEKHLPKESKKIIGEITRIINEPIKEFGLSHPSFGKPFALGEDMWRAVHDVDKVNKFIDNNLSLTWGLKTVPGKALALGSTAFGIGKIAEKIHLFKNHPVALKHLGKAINAAVLQDATAFGREMAIIDRQIKKSNQ